MNKAEYFWRRSIEADERAAKAATREEKQIWTNIASAYDEHAEMVVEEQRRDASQVS